MKYYCGQTAYLQCYNFKCSFVNGVNGTNGVIWDEIPGYDPNCSTTLSSSSSSTSSSASTGKL